MGYGVPHSTASEGNDKEMMSYKAQVLKKYPQSVCVRNGSMWEVWTALYGVGIFLSRAHSPRLAWRLAANLGG